MNKIEWNKVTWYSQIIALILFGGVFALGLYLGIQYGRATALQLPYDVPTAIAPMPGAPLTVTPAPTGPIINSVVFYCPSGQSIAANFYAQSVSLKLSDGRAMTLPQSISADGARYTNPSGSFVFWNKGNGAFIQENGTTTYTGCVTQSQ